ncbi:MAG: hypothetical protein ACK559_24085, partial [bacterium]
MEGYPAGRALPALGARGGARRARAGRLRGRDRGPRRIGTAITRTRARATPEERRGRGSAGRDPARAGRPTEVPHPRAPPHQESDRPDAGAGPAQAEGRFTAWRPAAADSWAPPAGRRSRALAPGPGPRVRGLRPARGDAGGRWIEGSGGKGSSSR